LSQILNIKTKISKNQCKKNINFNIEMKKLGIEMFCMHFLLKFAQVTKEIIIIYGFCALCGIAGFAFNSSRGIRNKNLTSPAGIVNKFATEVPM